MLKTLVPTLLIANEKVGQLDISSAHPCTLVRLLLDLAPIVGTREAHAEADRLRAELEAGTFYERLANECGLDKDTTKRRFLAAMNGKNGHTYNEKVFKIFALSYPVTKRVILIVRKTNRKALGRKMTKIVSSAIDVCLKFCMENDIPAISRTDEIVCREREVELLRKVLSGAFYDLTTVKAKVGGTLTTWADIYPEEKPSAVTQMIVDDNMQHTASQYGALEIRSAK
jgi:hypothetical protein